MVTLFVYYKLPIQEHAQWAVRVRDFQQTVKQRWQGMTVELMQRPEPSSDGLETWMEVYRYPPQGLSSEVMAAITQLAEQNGLPLKRATEIFVPLR